MTVDLRKEQQASLERPRYPYSAVARFFFSSMDAMVGREATLAKATLIETLAGVPYRAWQNRQYPSMKRNRDDELVGKAPAILAWAREAEDNEHRHLLVIEEKMRQDGVKEPWYLSPPSPQLMARSYALLTWAMALLDTRRGFLLNAELEDHAEHTYAQMVRDHPEWEEQPVASEVVTKYGDFETWADVFRRIALDERDHMNNSFRFCGKPDRVVQYEGMPEAAG